MKKLDIKNEYISDLYISGKDLNIVLTSEKYFRAMTACLATNARAMDHGMGGEDREFHYDSKRSELIVTLNGDNISQAIEILEYGGYFNKAEKDSILKQLTSPKSQTTIKIAFSDKKGEFDDTIANEKTPLLGK